MKKKTLWITETALMLAALVALQSLTKPFGQLVTGSCVNAVLAVTALVSGVYSAVVVAVFSPILAFLLGIAPQILTVPAIMAGNLVYVVALYFIAGRGRISVMRRAAAWVVSAAAKFSVLYLIVVGLICGLMSESLMAAGTLKAPMLQALPVTFSWPQLFTALIGGGVALCVTPVIRKVLRREAA